MRVHSCADADADADLGDDHVEFWITGMFIVSCNADDGHAFNWYSLVSIVSCPIDHVSDDH
jgi:hypothetical protein